MAQEGIAKVPNQELAQWAKCFLSSSFLLLSSDGLAQYCVHFIRSSDNPIAFHNFKISQGTHNHYVALQKLWLPVWDAIFIVICTHANLKIT